MREDSLKLYYNLKVWKLFFLLFPLITPSQLALQTLFGNSIGSYILMLFRLWNIVSILVVVFAMLSKQRLEKYCVLILLFCIILIFSTLLQEDVSLTYIVRSLGSTSMLFFLSGFYKHEEFIYYLQAIYYTLTIHSFFAASTIYLYYPNGIGMENYYLYGLDNISFIYAFYGFAVGFVYNLVAYKKLKSSFSIIYIFIAGAYLYAKTGTGTAIILICIMFVVIYKRNFLKKIDYRTTLIICVLMFLFFVVVQQFGFVNNIFLSLGKDSTLNGRTRIWEVGLSVIREHWLLGIGISDTVISQYLKSAGLVWKIEIGHLHNIVLEILCRGGILAFGIFIGLWIKAYKKMQKNSGHIISYTLNILIVLSWLICMFEFRITMYPFWFLLILAYHVQDLIYLYHK